MSERACILCWVDGRLVEPVVFIDPGWYCAAHAEYVRVAWLGEEQTQ